MNSIADFGFIGNPMTRSDSCERHGAFESKCIIGSIWSKCPVCAEEMAEATRKAREQKDREDLRQAWQRRIIESGIPSRFQNRSLKSYVPTTKRQEEALKFSKAYADGFNEVLKTGRSAIYVGAPGTGKTHLTCGIGLRIMRDNRTVLFTSVFRAVRRIKEAWHRDSVETESQVVAAFVCPDLLILDEVGQQFGSETEKLILFDILNERYEKRRPTLLLANIPLEDYRRKDDPPDMPLRPGVISYLGERLVDRLREDGGEYVILDGESMRGKL